MSSLGRGFTVIELIVAIVVAGILAGIALPAFGGVRSALAVRDAQQALASLQARARAHAVEFGQTVELHVDVSGDSMWIERNDTTLESVDLGADRGVDIQGAATHVTLCMNSRGYGDSGCTSFSSAVTISFVSAGETATVEILPLGQVRY